MEDVSQEPRNGAVKSVQKACGVESCLPSRPGNSELSDRDKIRPISFLLLSPH